MEGEGKDEKLPPGFRFHPTDEELITCYLIEKISDPTFTGRAIGDVDLNKSEPWDLPAKAKMGEKEWYFFSLRDRKYPTGVRTNRATNTGYWKTTGKDKEIYNSESSELIGMKKTLVFYRGRAPRGEKTNWVMHEYRIHSKSSFRNTKQDEWVVSRVFQKSAGGKKFPSNHHTRATLNPSNITNPYYNLEIGQNAMQLPTQLMHHQQQAAEAMAASQQFPYGSRSYMMMANNNNNSSNMAEMAEMARVLRTVPTSSTTHGMNFPLPSQYNYPSVPGGNGGVGNGDGGCFTISGLNLNLGGGATTSGQQVLRPVSQPVLNQQELGGEGVGVYGGAGEVNGANAGGNNRYMEMESCVDLVDNYWTPY